MREFFLQFGFFSAAFLISVLLHHRWHDVRLIETPYDALASAAIFFPGLILGLLARFADWLRDVKKSVPPAI
ncbi:MAG: hypothetical protein AABZ44_06395, partial [Elusimicrobiota bacterium]